MNKLLFSNDIKMIGIDKVPIFQATGVSSHSRLYCMLAIFLIALHICQISDILVCCKECVHPKTNFYIFIYILCVYGIFNYIKICLFFHPHNVSLRHFLPKILANFMLFFTHLSTLV